MHWRPKFKSGYISLISTLIMLTVLVVLLSSTQIIIGNNGEGTLARRLGVEANRVAESCLEDTLIRLRGDLTYTGANLNLAGGYCTITIVDSAVNEKTITIEASVLSQYYSNLVAVVDYLQTNDVSRLTLVSKTRN